MKQVISRKWSNFEEHYNRHLPTTAEFIVEIGVEDGGSLYALKDKYPAAKILGIDIDLRCKAFVNLDRNIHVEIGNQSNYRWLQKVIYDHGSPDVIIDDGGHKAHQIMLSFCALFPLLKSGGLYIIEDIGCCWDPRWSLIPGLALFYLTAYCGSKYPMHWYNNLLMIERRLEIPSLVVTRRFIE